MQFFEILHIIITTTNNDSKEPAIRIHVDSLIINIHQTDSLIIIIYKTDSLIIHIHQTDALIKMNKSLKLKFFIIKIFQKYLSFYKFVPMFHNVVSLDTHHNFLPLFVDFLFSIANRDLHSLLFHQPQLHLFAYIFQLFISNIY